MRRCLGVALLALACAAQAGGGTLRVGSQVLVVGDSASRVIELLGKPAYRSSARTDAGRSSGRKKGAKTSSGGGQQWQYRQGNRLVTIVVADGKVAAIRDDGR